MKGIENQREKAYRLMKDEEAAYSLGQTRQDVGDACMSWIAAELIQETSESRYFDRFVLEYRDEMREECEELFDNAFDQHKAEVEAARKAGYDASGLEFDEDEAEDILEQVKCLAFDRIGLRGLMED